MTRVLLGAISLTIIIVSGCSNEKVENNSIEQDEIPVSADNDITVKAPEESVDEVDEVEEETDDATDTVVEQEISMRDFLLPNNSKAHYQGEGNEFAELDIDVEQLFENYIIVYENNGGSYWQKIYKIGTDKIEIIAEDIIEFEPAIPTLQQLEQMKPIGVYLQKPFTEGTKFEEWTIVETGATVETPYKIFDNAIVIEMVEADFVNRKYFVPGSGEVKRESIMTMEGEEDYIVTSVLESVE